MGFPSNSIGTVRTKVSKTQRKDAYWGSGAHDVSQQYTYSHSDTYSYRTPIVRGDHFNSYPYFRKGAKVLRDRPSKRYQSGSDRNGSYYDQRTEHMSIFLPLDVYDASVDPWNSRLSELIGRCETETLNKLREEKVSWGSNVLQASRTAEELAGPLIRLLRAVRFAKRGNWKGVQSLLGPPSYWINGKVVSNVWLAYQYGWKPLMSDVYGGVNILKNKLGDNGKAFKIRHRVKGEFKLPNVSGGGGYVDDWSFDARIQCGMHGVVSSNYLVSLDSFGLANPLEVAWDLLPWSFVIDWFVPVGNTLSSLSATLGLSLSTGYTSVYSTALKTSRLVRVDPPWKITDSGELTVEYNEFKRTVHYTWPSPSFYGKSNPFSTPHVLNALALMRQLF